MPVTFSPKATPAGAVQQQSLLFGWLLLLLAWALATLTGLVTRTMIPVDELRYASVAWEMWSRGDFLVPYLNGEAYSHKPPLFFWLIHAGWWLFGVNEHVVRLVAPLLMLVILVLAAWLARLLWPRQAGVAQLSPGVLLSCVFLLGFFAWVQIDLLLVASTLLALCGVVLAADGRRAGWLLTGVGLGLGLLSKGPVILLHVLPLAWLAPLWIAPEARPRWLAWYAGSVFSVLVGAALVLAWALPAAQAGGEAYRQAIFWGQTVHRVVESFAHAHPAWWYLPWLLVLFAPWILLPWLWRATQLAWQQRDRGMRFCVTWMLVVLLLLSLVSGKQGKYLLPMLPAFALLVSRVLVAMPGQPVAQRPWLLGGLLVLIGVAGMRAPYVISKAAWLNEVSPWWGGLLLVLGVLYLLLPAGRPRQYPVRMLLLSLCTIMIAEIGVLRVGAPAYDLKAASRLIADAQAEGRPVAITENYHGQFGFYGRLRQPLQEIADAQIRDWTQAHPNGYLVMTGKKSDIDYPGVIFQQPYQSGYLVIVGAGLSGMDSTRQPVNPNITEHQRNTVP